MAIKLPSSKSRADFLACKTSADVAAILGTSEARLNFHLFSPKSPPYLDFKIPKANGGSRQISVPPPYVRLWQRELLKYLTALYTPKPSAHGFIPDRSIKSNAKAHARRRLLLNIDLEEFFPSIHFGRVLGVFSKAPFSFPYGVAVLLAQICTNRGCLPQGAPTSPMLSNFVCRRMDNELRVFALRRGCTYTRFADDMTFSTNKTKFSEAIIKVPSYFTDATELGDKLVEIVTKHDFRVNWHKTRLRKATERQEVTGLVVNKKINVPKIYVRRLRAILHDWETNGYKSAEKKFQLLDGKRKTRAGPAPKLSAHVGGKLEFLKMVRGSGDTLYTKYALIAKKLGGIPQRVAVHGAASEHISFLSDATWVLIGRDSSGADVAQGTAFYLKSIGFVTAAHVLSKPAVPVKDWVLIRGSAPWDEFDVVARRENVHLDLAILETSADSQGQLVMSEVELDNGASVGIVGYPNWHSTGDQLLRAQTHVVHKKTVSGVSLIGVSYPLLSGNSGGPALDSSGEVIGVVVRSKDDSAFPNGIVNIKHLSSVTSEPLIKH